ncbi:hypothetical protein OIU76_004364 [Salix suchowensis]|nr:hypothetical protein OIU76_004364 [Salix suchowensis]
MPLRNVVSWNIMLALYLKCKKYSDCLRFFDMMVRGNFVPDEASLVSVLTACAELKMLDQGKWVHSYMKNNGIKPDMLLSTALLTMYAKCGAMDLAREVFDVMPEKKCRVMEFYDHWIRYAWTWRQSARNVLGDGEGRSYAK